MVLGLAVLFITGCSHERQITVKDKDGNVIAGVSESEEPVFDSEEEWLAYMTKDRSNYITIKGENTVLFIGQLDGSTIENGLDVSSSIAVIRNGNYVNEGFGIWEIEERYFLSNCNGDSYVMCGTEEEFFDITDNIDGDFEKFSLTGGGTYYLKYITCPLKDYEFYINGHSYNMGMAD